MRIFRNDTLTRLDLGRYSAGTNRGVYVDNRRVPGRRFFIYGLRRALIKFRTLNCAGWFDELPQHLGRVFWTGSFVEPQANWHLRLGRFYVGGRTPAWVLKRMQDRAYRRALAAAKAGDGRYEICAECKNGLVCIEEGYPGETFEVCKSCRHVFGSQFDKSAVE